MLDKEIDSGKEQIASHTKQPGLFRELFAALGNDPFDIAQLKVSDARSISPMALEVD